MLTEKTELLKSDEKVLEQLRYNNERQDGLPQKDFTAFERRIETLKKHLAETPLYAVTQWAKHHLNQWHDYREDAVDDEAAMAACEIIYWNTLLDILEEKK